jgi:AraC-like DNA-binding protein
VTRDDTHEERQARSRSFLSRVESPAGYDVLFDHLSDVYFFVKDAEGRFIRVNRAFLGLVNATSETDVIGARDADFFPASLAENYVRDDREVIRLSQPMIDKAELVRNPDASVDWFFTTKLPVFDKDSRAIGVCGITRDVKKMIDNNAQLLSWAPVLETIVNDYASPLDVPALAEKLELSVSQFQRRFRKRFHTTPRAYQRSVRLNAACQLLATTKLTISEIAGKTGFYDQSYFSNQFIKSRGVPPSKYRLRHTRGQSADELTLAAEAARAADSR